MDRSATEDVGMMRALGETRKGDWMETVSGRRFYPLDARAEEVCLHDVAHALARVNRYNGHIRLDHYSVAEHCVLMADRLYELHGNAMVALQALHHDDPEAYIGDMVRPLKRNMPSFTDAEVGVHNACMDKFGLPRELHHWIKEADNRILVDEREQAMNRSGNTWGIDHLEPLGVTIRGWCPAVANNLFLGAHFKYRDLARAA